jgi:hypothetical protein
VQACDQSRFVFVCEKVAETLGIFDIAFDGDEAAAGVRHDISRRRDISRCGFKGKDSM